LKFHLRAQKNNNKNFWVFFSLQNLTLTLLHFRSGLPDQEMKGELWPEVISQDPHLQTKFALVSKTFSI
jgi:hypothetical protein